MQILQRYILIVGMSMLLALYITVIFDERVIMLTKDWESIQTDRFISKLCRNGVCTEEEDYLFLEVLNNNGNEVNIRIEEYRLEQNLNSKRYYPVKSWEEIKCILSEEKKYVFLEDSIISLEISYTERSKNWKSKRFGRIIGEYGYGT